MASPASTKKTTPDEPKESPVDPMMDAPDARPYGEAITDEHRATLAESGIVVE